MRPNPMRIGPSSTLRQRLHLRVSTRNWLFLGYPYDDVHEFIAQRGENYKIFGAWKVYTNAEQALATFDAYRACTQHLTFIYQQGCSLAQLAQATR